VKELTDCSTSEWKIHPKCILKIQDSRGEKRILKVTREKKQCKKDESSE
jgi:hypothetical protein